MDARRRRKRNESCPLQEIFLFLFVLGLAVIKDVGGFMVSTLCKRPWSCPSQEAKEALRPFGCRAPFNPNFPSTRLRTSPSSSPTSSSSSHLSILELLKATIGLHSGPWSLPISNTSVVRLSTAREVWNETEPWRRYPVGFSRPSSTAFVADLDK
ncbi:hypothetical protein NGA_0138600 [Nannochloropsis gaditana CCMP526]|uniref:uncharacterized protein n=1 Tax=Nannochloropsis gaditana (strain CCMP526) TaxID=1093141 RepID=UPI00029F719C|nr:hypothetical protein NGA_0138600 [Nannochloropsis gaditana CCMP526]EKU21162.1 hypothetical protein NGA_0138600 [Nannochloropsis gaditana CCMP526]|eukprot:XP_005855193.1 hypothetical protein NGA_0138600 [Nannochloropsis gaditana CCMP526]